MALYLLTVGLLMGVALLGMGGGELERLALERQFVGVTEDLNDTSGGNESWREKKREFLRCADDWFLRAGEPCDYAALSHVFFELTSQFSFLQNISHVVYLPVDTQKRFWAMLCYPPSECSLVAGPQNCTCLRPCEIPPNKDINKNCSAEYEEMIQVLPPLTNSARCDVKAPTGHAVFILTAIVELFIFGS